MSAPNVVSLIISSDANICPCPRQSPSWPARHRASTQLPAIHLLRNLRAVDKESRPTPARLSALSVLVFGGSMPLGRLARIEGVTSPTMTRIVDGLVVLGLAEQRTHPDSARLVMVVATDRGHNLMETAAERRFGAIANGLGAARRRPEAVRAAAAALRDLATRVMSKVHRPVDAGSPTGAMYRSAGSSRCRGHGEESPVHVFTKLGVADRTAAVTAALDWGLISLPRRTPG